MPVYLHPGLSPKGVADIYYSGLPGHPGMPEALACYGWGWHSETALHVLRLLFAGIFDKYPKLNLIIGHMGEMLPMNEMGIEFLNATGLPDEQLENSLMATQINC